MMRWLGSRKKKSAAADDKLTDARDRLIAEIREDARETVAYTGREQFSERVMAAMAKVPRHEFVSEEEKRYAYINRPLGIGQGQTISQPFIVAIMTDLLDLTPDDKVLEIGTGCGYQAAVLAEIAKEVFSIETLPVLATAARERLDWLGYKNVHVRTGDGYDGWPEEAPFDGIIVTSAPTKIPETLVKQLKPGGRLVIPVGGVYETQTLYRCVKESDGGLRKQRILPVAFVPMVKSRN